MKASTVSAVASVLVGSMTSFAQPSPAPRLGSAVFAWDTLEVKPTPVGERRDVIDLPTATLERFECHISTLAPDRASHPPHTHPQEELIILHEGVLDVFINGRNERVGPGALFWFA
ncbi:MAG TPA: cupin domain-containing protein, partial [Candidatus Synoicihabitans sp.]|nr:cupin domain-containing protein [Candidatus Synoicihabitans sp.]